MEKFALILLISASLHCVVQCLDREMTVQVNPKEMECFFENLGKITLARLYWRFIIFCRYFAAPNFIIDIEYQGKSGCKCKRNFIIDSELFPVIDGGHGDLDINFELSLNGRILFVGNVPFILVCSLLMFIRFRLQEV